MKVCVKCRSRNLDLYMGFQFGKYKCKDCGYIGPLVINHFQRSFNKKQKKIKVCNSLFSKIKGLMFSKPRDLLLLNVNSIHSFFVFFDFDAYFLDENFRVIEKKRIKPFSFAENKKAKHVLETVGLKYKKWEKVKYD